MVQLLPITDAGIEVKTLILTLDVKEGIDVRKAIKAACTEYCKTEEGRRTYEGNRNSFNWGDFDTYVPNTICEKYGIRKVDSQMFEEEFEYREQLVEETEIFPEEE